MINKLTPIVIGIITLALILGVGTIFLTSMNNNVLSEDIISSSSEIVLVANGTDTTLDGVPLSLLATRKNNTWLEFDGVNDYIFITDEFPFTMSNRKLNYFWQIF